MSSGQSLHLSGKLKGTMGHASGGSEKQEETRRSELRGRQEEKISRSVWSVTPQ